MNILEALKKYIRTNGGSSRANNISEAVKDLDSIPQSSGGGGMVVHFEINPLGELNPISADKTPAEVYTAMTDGVVVTGVANVDAELMPLGVCSVLFFGADFGFIPTYMIENDDINASFFISTDGDSWVLNVR